MNFSVGMHFYPTLSPIDTILILKSLFQVINVICFSYEVKAIVAVTAYLTVDPAGTMVVAMMVIGSLLAVALTAVVDVRLMALSVMATTAALEQ